MILLHGLVSTGDVFGAGFDRIAESNRLVVPDLLGFGRSLDEDRQEFATVDHLDALDEMALQADLMDKQWVIGAHSMGSALALAWANRHHDRVDRIVCWGAPIYSSPEVTRSQISGSPMARLFALDTAIAERACMISCRHRTLAGWVTAAVQPNLPLAIARSVSQHTWRAYRDAMNNLVIDTDWNRLLAHLDQNETSVKLIWGTEDKVGDLDYARSIVQDLAHSTVNTVDGADHHLPMTHPRLCREHLA